MIKSLLLSDLLLTITLSSVISAAVSIATTLLYHRLTRPKPPTQLTDSDDLLPDVIRTLEMEPDPYYESVEVQEWKVEQEILEKRRLKEMES
jgi:hypothetical protein